jgi:DNA-binding NtrC family response regulator
VSRPLILFIDDVYGNSQSDRFRLCQRLRVQSVNPGDDLRIEGAKADAWFTPSQRRIGDRVENDASVALDLVRKFWHSAAQRRLALVLLDLQFDQGPVREGPLHPDRNWPSNGDETFGLKILQEMIDQWPDPNRGPGHCRVPVIVLSSQGRAIRSGQAARGGALAYIEKENLTPDRLSALLDEHGLLDDDTGALSGRSVALLEALRSAREAARSARGNLLILGGRGTGKTSMANYIHRHSSRAEHAMQTFTVQPGSEQLLVAQLFGAWPGAYTDSPGPQVGAAERAHRGILFLDEIANLPPRGQADLLEYGRLRDDRRRALKRLGNFPSGSSALAEARRSIVGQFDPQTQLIFVDVFLIAATNQPIDDPEYRRESGFLPDLFDRLGREYGVHLKFPSLVDRPDDIPLLFEQFLEEETCRQEGRWPKTTEPGLMERLLKYDWPGNVADLRGVATEVARRAKDWEEALEKFLPLGLLGNERSTGTLPESATDQPPLPPPVVNVATLGSPVKSQRTQLDGALLHLNAEYGRQAEELLEAALDLTRDTFGSARKSEILGDLSPTKAMKILLRQSLSTMQAADLIKRIFELSGKNPVLGSFSARVLQYARHRRTAGNKKEGDIE